jgi:hypothetical protein
MGDGRQNRPRFACVEVGQLTGWVAAEEGQWRSLRSARFGVGPPTYRLALHVEGDGATGDDDGDGAMGDGRRSCPRFAWRLRPGRAAGVSARTARSPAAVAEEGQR